MTLPARPLAIAALVCAHVRPVVFGALTPGYSAVSQFISELGAIEAPYGALVSLGTFLLAGVLLVLSCLALTSRAAHACGATWAGNGGADWRVVDRRGLRAVRCRLAGGRLAAPGDAELAPARGALQRVMELTASAWILASAWSTPVRGGVR